MDFEKYRDDFPVLQQKIDDKPIIYFDNACMTLKPKPVIDSMNDYYENFSACGVRSIHKFSAKVTVLIDEVRRKYQKFINARHPTEIVFTRNTTEGINLVGYSFGFQKGEIGRAHV